MLKKQRKIQVQPGLSAEDLEKYKGQWVVLRAADSSEVLAAGDIIDEDLFRAAEQKGCMWPYFFHIF